MLAYFFNLFYLYPKLHVLLNIKYHARIGKDTKVQLRKGLWKLRRWVVCPIQSYKNL